VKKPHLFKTINSFLKALLEPITLREVEPEKKDSSKAVELGGCFLIIVKFIYLVYVFIVFKKKNIVSVCILGSKKRETKR